MLIDDDDLTHFEAHGLALPDDVERGHVDTDGARIAYAATGSGASVILLHGGLGHGGNWGKQVPALRDAGYRPIVIDSRGHGRSTRDARPYRYEHMGDDVLAVMNALGIAAAPIIGWSDGACTGLILADRHPARVTRVLYFGCNMDSSGTLDITWPNALLERCFARHKRDYAALSATPDEFEAFVEAVSLMERTQPEYSADALANIDVPVLVVHSEHDEFIKHAHAAYLARTLPRARLAVLPGVSHFAPLQRPALFNRHVLDFLSGASIP
ncbi:alpha/beta fold hydrolase [Pararobbsia silviterrae]|uniref:Alpha/beta hydrolase n=1 Tax=Pararobbsia silviterrae TaxID=1792498 RepID=A0A494XSV9_9BURK|nr:alpha/beta hydrolase [Pararobbsia silviterrae]RKP51966.1 alpha/beta hydrolase [Pararobbsia silviterrae]